MRCLADRKTRVLSVFVVCSTLLLCGADCININIPLSGMEDAGGYWAKGALDEQLEGMWYPLELDEAQDVGVGAIRFTKSGNAYALASLEKGDGVWTDVCLAKTLTVGKHDFMMWQSGKEAASEQVARAPKGHIGMLWLYTVEGGRLTLYMLDSEALDKAAEDPRWRDVLELKRVRKQPARKDHPEETTVVRVPRLDEKTLTLLDWLAANPENWSSDDTVTFTREPPAKQEPGN